MFLKKIILGHLKTNCYVLFGGGEGAVVIDPAQDFEVIEAVLNEEGLRAEAVLLTHGHLDHTNAAKQFQERGVPVYLHQEDAVLIGDDFGFGYPFEKKVFVPDFGFEHGQELEFAGLKIKVLHTPGHSAGSVCFLVEDKLFSGDTLFCRYIGRTDLTTGNQGAIEKSIREILYTLPPKTKVYSGHGAETTIASEMKSNYYVRG